MCQKVSPDIILIVLSDCRHADSCFGVVDQCRPPVSHLRVGELHPGPETDGQHVVVGHGLNKKKAVR